MASYEYSADMPTPKEFPDRATRRSTTVPLSLVPALAALVTVAGCGTNRVAMDPCEPSSFEHASCDSAVAHHGYWYGGMWYPHVYPYMPLFYYNGYRSYVGGGGQTRGVSPTVYAPPSTTPSRPGVVRGGFGGIGEGHTGAGS